MTRSIALLLLLALVGCAEQKPTKAKHAKAPEGYTQNGYCVPDGVNAKTGKPDFLLCTQDDGEHVTYKRQ